MILILIFVVKILVTNSQYAIELELGHIERCSSALNKHVDTDEEFIQKINLQTEEEIGKDGHFSGFVPDEYDIELSFENDTHYIGCVYAQVRVVKESKYLVFNIGRQSPAFDYESIQIYYLDATLLPNDVCIAGVTVVTSQEILVVAFNRTLSVESELSVQFGLIKSKVFDQMTNEGAKGLRSSLIGDSLALFTLFHMREARTVFPCMDHPSLKAKFQLCLNFSSKFSSLSNADEELTNQIPDHKYYQKCFKRTFMIPTHSFGFVLMHNYFEMSSHGRDASLFVPESQQGKYFVVLAEAKKTFRYMVNLTNFAFPFKCTNLVVVRLPLITGTGSMQLVLLDVAVVELPRSSSLTTEVVYHELIRQWVGNTVTVKDWNDVCLQESLITYLSWLLLAQDMECSMQSLVRKHIRKHIDKDYNFGANANISESELLRSCTKQPPIFLHMLAERIGIMTIKTFLRMLIHKYASRNAGKWEWEEQLTYVTEGNTFPKLFLRQWIYNAGPVTFEIRLQNEIVTIRQRTDDRVEFNPYASFPLFCSADAKPFLLTFGNETEINFTVSQATQWCLADLGSQTLTRKLYDSSTYLAVTSGRAYDPHLHLTAERLDDFMEDFCAALLMDQLPLDRDTNIGLWKQTFELVRRQTVLGSKCNCCVTDPSLRKETCSYIVAQCDALKINTLIQFGEYYE